MRTISITVIQSPQGPVLTPAEPLPADALAIVCNGTTYTVYEQGDTPPPPPPAPEPSGEPSWMYDPMTGEPIG